MVNPQTHRASWHSPHQVARHLTNKKFVSLQCGNVWNRLSAHLKQRCSLNNLDLRRKCRGSHRCIYRRNRFSRLVRPPTTCLLQASRPRKHAIYCRRSQAKQMIDTLLRRQGFVPRNFLSRITFTAICASRNTSGFFTASYTISTISTRSRNTPKCRTI